MSPQVSFVVPCYKLAHFLPECITSILEQTYQNIEVLIMDDCSPDETPEVARSFRDPRVKYFRNEKNLGPMQNFNKGIGLAGGKYIWLISADDVLRRPYVVERYVEVMEKHPEVGYAFCPAVGLVNSKETGVLGYTAHGERDDIFNGHQFLAKLLSWNSIAAASGMVRRECYEKVGLFPVDLPYAGDWYGWCAFALHYDVAYFAEPMVNYRAHEGGLTKYFKNTDPGRMAADDLTCLWRIKRNTQSLGLRALATTCEKKIASRYVWCILPELHDASIYRMTPDECQQSVSNSAATAAEAARVNARVNVGLGDQYYRRRDLTLARRAYERGLREYRWMPIAWAKYLLVVTGGAGVFCRTSLKFLRDFIATAKSRYVSNMRRSRRPLAPTTPRQYMNAIDVRETKTSG